MATYTEIEGQGKLLTGNITGATTFTVVPPPSQTGSVYFTLETIRNSSGDYDSTSPTNAIGSYSSFVNCSGLVTSSYIFSVVVGFDLSGSCRGSSEQPNQQSPHRQAPWSKANTSPTSLRCRGIPSCKIVPHGAVKNVNLKRHY